MFYFIIIIGILEGHAKNQSAIFVSMYALFFLAFLLDNAICRSLEHYHPMSTGVPVAFDAFLSF